MIDPADYVRIDSWQALAEEIGGRLVYRNTEHVPEFFRQVAGTGRECVLLSGHSDYWVAEQAVEHPNADLFKAACATHWERPMTNRSAYCQVEVGPCCKPERCLNEDKYSLKTERMTWETFADIPAEVRRWYTTNLNVVHPRASPLPFGLNTDGHGLSILPAYVGRKKDRRLYVNFQDNSLDRVHLKAHYRERTWVFYRENVPVEQYLEDMARSQFVLCPAGNGPDCYRVWESIYLGCYPVLQDGVFARYLLDAGLPVAVVDNLFGLGEDLLYAVGEQFDKGDFNYDFARLSHWRAVLEAASGTHAGH